MMNYTINYFTKNKSLKPLVVVAPNKNSSWAKLKIPSNIYVDIVRYIVKFNNVLIVGDKNDIEYNSNISHYFHNDENLIDLTGKTDFDELVELVNESSLVISAENGIAHLAGSLGKRVYVIYTFSDPLVYSWPNSYGIYHNKKYNCMPCVSLTKTPNDNYPVLCKYNFRCNNTVNVDDVINDLIKMGFNNNEK